MSAVALSKVFAYKCAEGRKIAEMAGGPDELFRMGEKKLKDIIRDRRVIGQIQDPDTRRWAEEEIEWCRQYGIEILYHEDKRYPRRLNECYDAPIILYAKGCCDLNPSRALAVVGTRRATYYGKSCCTGIVRGMAGLSKPPVIVSGLAYGIDAAAHTAALDNGLETFAVIPSGLDRIYPPQHRDLAARIITQGALVTDFPRCSYPQVAHFVRRNRIIAGMSDATLLVESFATGGGLITTSLANAYDRDVFAVPGRNSDSASEGCNKLIENNLAHLVTGAESISANMGWKDASSRRKEARLPLEFTEDGDRARIYGILKDESPLEFEVLMTRSGLDFPTLTQLLLEMEIDGRIISIQGHKYGLRP